MKFAFAATTALVATAAAHPVVKETPCETPVPTVTVTPTATAIPCATQPSVPVVAVSNNATETAIIGGVCANLPVGLQGVAIANVAYEVQAGLFGCQGKCESTTVWCDQTKDKNGNIVNNYLYCCGNECKAIPSVPKDKTCKVNGIEYTVGHAYNVVLEGQAVTMWCTTENDHVTCAGQECGSTVELTPPGPAVCKVPVPVSTSVATPVVTPSYPPRPHYPHHPHYPQEPIYTEEPEYPSHTQEPEYPTYTQTPDVTYTPDTDDFQCELCIQHGKFYNLATGECQEQCPKDYLLDCTRDVNECP